MKASLVPILVLCLYLPPQCYSLDASDKSSSVSTEATTIKPKIQITNSTICKKCLCDVDNKKLDCTEKLNAWFTDEEWSLLQRGDIIFETIKLDKNNLTNVPILPLYGVKNLYLANNLIEEITDGAFQNLTELTTLDLSHNNFTSKSLRPDAFQGLYVPDDYEPLKNLKSLNLGYNQLHFLDDDLFEHLPNLEELILCSNTFQIINQLTEAAFGELTSLKTLDMSYMELASLPETLLHSPRNLQTFIASGNLFKEVPKTLTYSINLERLVLDDNPIDNLEGENIFPTLSKLKYLSLSYMPDLYKIGAGAFSELQNLTELILSDNKMLATIDQNAFSKNVTHGEYLDYPPLDKLYLNNCNLTKLSRSMLVRWDKLSIVDLRFNPWYCDASNEWMIDLLVPQIAKNTLIFTNDVKCATPEKLTGVPITRVAAEHLLDNQSNGGTVWIGLLVSVLIAVPISLAAFALYRRGCFGLAKRNDSVARRALYNRASFNEDFHI